MKRRYLLLLLFAAPGCAGAASRSPPHTESECANAAWTAPEMVRTRDGRPVYVEKPQAGVLSRGTALFGSPTFVWATADTFLRSQSPSEIRATAQWAGVVLNTDGTAEPIPLPPRDSQWFAPLPLQLARRRVGVVWGDGHLPNQPSFQVTELRYAEFDGRAWTLPERIAVADAIWWEGNTRTGTVIGDTIHVAARGYDNTHGKQWIGALYLRRINGQWRDLPITKGFEFFPRYVALATEKSGSLGLYYTGTVVTRDSARSGALAVLRSADGGSTWGAPELIQVLDSSSGYWLTATRTINTVHLLTAVLASAGGEGRLEHVIASGAGALMPASALELPGLKSYDVLSTGEALDVVVQGAGSGGPQHVQWSEAGWSALAPVPAPKAISVARLARDERGALLVTWGDARGAGGATPAQAPVLMLTRRVCR